MIRRFFVAIITLVLFACSDDDKNLRNELDLDIVTGIDLRADANFEPIRLGNPNSLNANTIVFPNPSMGKIVLKTRDNSSISSVLIINGRKNTSYNNIDFETVLRPDLYSQQQIMDKSVLDFSFDFDSNEVILNIENLEEGYYRVFVKTENNLEWHNIYKGENVNIQELIDNWEN